MSDEQIEIWRALDEHRKAEGARRWRFAARTFQAAASAAIDAGLTLTRRTGTHYQLCKARGWLINLYPSNQRIYVDPNRPKAPYLRLPREWTLLDAVRAAAKAEEQNYA